MVERGDTIYNGANDDASGVSAVISLAKYFKALNNNERTLLFVAFTGEELGLLGSKYFADDCEPDSIIAVINIEMIGRGRFSNPRPFVTGYEKSDLFDILNRNYRSVPGKNSEKEFFKVDKNTNEFLFKRSDNYSFAVKGVPAHSIMVTPSNDEYYHNLNDETKTLDFNLMKKVIRAIAIGTTGLITGKDTPSRIKEAD
jgi:Zn-dependent M28 family amino/carboxypeptidase